MLLARALIFFFSFSSASHDPDEKQRLRLREKQEHQNTDPNPKNSRVLFIKRGGIHHCGVQKKTKETPQELVNFVCSENALADKEPDIPTESLKADVHTSQNNTVPTGNGPAYMRDSLIDDSSLDLKRFTEKSASSNTSIEKLVMPTDLSLNTISQFAPGSSQLSEFARRCAELPPSVVKTLFSELKFKESTFEEQKKMLMEAIAIVKSKIELLRGTGCLEHVLKWPPLSSLEYKLLAPIDMQNSPYWPQMSTAFLSGYTRYANKLLGWVRPYSIPALLEKMKDPRFIVNCWFMIGPETLYDLVRRPNWVTAYQVMMSEAIDHIQSNKYRQIWVVRYESFLNAYRVINNAHPEWEEFYELAANSKKEVIDRAPTKNVFQENEKQYLSLLAKEEKERRYHYHGPGTWYNERQVHKKYILHKGGPKCFMGFERVYVFLRKNLCLQDRLIIDDEIAEGLWDIGGYYRTPEMFAWTPILKEILENLYKKRTDAFFIPSILLKIFCQAVRFERKIDWPFNLMTESPIYERFVKLALQQNLYLPYQFKWFLPENKPAETLKILHGRTRIPLTLINLTQSPESSDPLVDLSNAIASAKIKFDLIGLTINGESNSELWENLLLKCLRHLQNIGILYFSSERKHSHKDEWVVSSDACKSVKDLAAFLFGMSVYHSGVLFEDFQYRSLDYDVFWESPKCKGLDGQQTDETTATWVASLQHMNIFFGIPMDALFVSLPTRLLEQYLNLQNQ